MSTYANAPAPHSALFDNAPTVPPMAQPAHTTPATRIYQDGKGKWQALDVLMQYGRPVPLALALRRVEIGRTVFVAREGAGEVMEAVRGTYGDNAHG